jgi:hypothetical protein
MVVLSVIYVPTLVVFARAYAGASRLERGTSLPAVQLAVARQVSADSHRARGDHRAAVIDASAAADYLQLALGVPLERSELDELRARALDPDGSIDEYAARRAVGLVEGWIRVTSEAAPTPP